MTSRVRVAGVACVLSLGALAPAPAYAAVPPIEPFTQTTVAGQSATRLVASYPSAQQATEAVKGAVCLNRSDDCGIAGLTQYYAYYGDRATGGFTTRPGFVSGVGAEYAGVDGTGGLLVSVSSYATPEQARRAVKGIARGAGISVKRVVRGVVGPESWPRYDIWTGASGAGDQGLLIAVSGAKYVRFWIYPPRQPWTPLQWRKAFQGFAPLLPQVMTALGQFDVDPQLQSLIPVMPASLTPTFFTTQDKSAWLPYGRLDPELYAAMGPRQLSLQYAIVGAPETLALNMTITPVLDAAPAQALVDRLPTDRSVAGSVTIDDLPVGTQVVHVDEGGVERLIYAQLVSKGALVEITCSDLSITSDLVSGRALCLAAVADAARAASAP